MFDSLVLSQTPSITRCGLSQRGCCLSGDREKATSTIEVACDATVLPAAFDGPVLSSPEPSEGIELVSRPVGNRKREKCCKKEIEAEVPERHLISSDIVRDIIIGLSDGLMVPFALTAGLSSLGSSKLVYQGGFAELMAGAISMGVGGYLSAKSEQDIFRHQYSAATRRLDLACASEVRRDVHDILGPFGIDPRLTALVADSLEKSQQDAKLKDETALHPTASTDTLPGGLRQRLRRAASAYPTSARGTAAFLVQLGQGMEAVPTRRLFISGLTISLSYFLGGLIPIIPYLCVSDALHGLYWSILATGIVLVLFGAAKAWYTGAATGKLGVLWGAASMLAVGAASAAAAYGLVKALAGHGD